MKRSIHYAFYFVLTVLTWASVCSPIAYAQNSKIYVLFIWGMEDEKVANVTQTSKEKIESLFLKTSKSHPGEFEMSRIEGKAAHPQNIINECKRIAQKAGPNDAVLVIALTHAAVVQYPDGKFRHALAPLAESSEEMKLETLGIRRGTIMKILKSSPHRLNILATDSCSGAYVTNRQGRPGLPSESKYPNESYLLSVLRYAEGDLNFNSTRPRSPGRPAELARGYAVRDLKVGETTKTLEKYENGREKLDDHELENLRYGGTVFANAFIAVASRSNYDKSEVNLNSFFKVLKDEQHKFYDEWIGYMIAVGAGGEAIYQKTQTLTKYDDDSVPIFEQDDAPASY